MYAYLRHDASPHVNVIHEKQRRGVRCDPIMISAKLSNALDQLQSFNYQDKRIRGPWPSLTLGIRMSWPVPQNVVPKSRK